MHYSFKSAKVWLSFNTGRNPVIAKPRKDFRNFVPEPYEGVVILSTDFELAWGWRFEKKSTDPIKTSTEFAARERANVPEIIKLSDQFGIPLTWGTIGHLFLKKCQSADGKPHPEIERLPYFENEWWKYNSGDWFDSDPCSSFEKSPEWYAPDLIKLILASNVKHEIANHSFSHITCNNNVCTSGVLTSELIASEKAADDFGIRMESFIFPGHTMGNYATIRKAGYSSIRTNFTNYLGYPVLHDNGLWEHKATMEIVYNHMFSIKYNQERYRKIIEKAIDNHQVCNLWFHPSFDEINIDTILPGIYNILEVNRKKLWITTMKEYTAWLTSSKYEIS
jgi:hypothetical protein